MTFVLALGSSRSPQGAISGRDAGLKAEPRRVAGAPLPLRPTGPAAVAVLAVLWPLRLYARFSEPRP
jgi:hypothetical protein